MPTIKFTVCLGIRGPIEPDEYSLGEKSIHVSYPETVDLGFRQFELPRSLSTLFIVSWEDNDGSTETQLRSQSFERHLPIYQALEAVSELLLAYKLVRVGHTDGKGLRSVGIGDTLMYFSAIDDVPTGDLNIGLKNYAGNNAWIDDNPKSDPHGTTCLAEPHIGAETLPIARRYVRCYELFEHGFYSEAFIVAFSVLDDFVQQTLDRLLEEKGLSSSKERKALLRGIKENRLRLYLGPVLKLVFGSDMETMWPESTSALEWVNSTRNRIAHAAEKADRATAARGIYVCLKVLVVMKEHGVAEVDLNVELFRHAKITASWTTNRPSWVPSGEVAESMDFRS
jgi:hypothetical protein